MRISKAVYVTRGGRGRGERGIGMPPNIVNDTETKKSYSHMYVVYHSSAHMLTSSEIFAYTPELWPVATYNIVITNVAHKIDFSLNIPPSITALVSKHQPKTASGQSMHVVLMSLQPV